MNLLLGGCAVLAGVCVIFAAFLPRAGRTHRFVGTALEPYAAVALTAGVTLAITMIIAGVLALLGS